MWDDYLYKSDKFVDQKRDEKVDQKWDEKVDQISVKSEDKFHKKTCIPSPL